MSFLNRWLGLGAALFGSSESGKSGTRKSSASRPSQFRKRRSSSRSTAAYAPLEPRQLLAVIVFDAANGNVILSGDAAADVGVVNEIGGGQIRVTMQGTPSRTFALSEVSRLSFIGRSGNDQFTNNTSIPSFQYGGDGDDTLTGGSARDVINGGPGNDSIFGRDGDDRLLASSGTDLIQGGNGNDHINGNSGVNDLRGDSGNDLIYGGDNADTIHGGDGADRVYGQGGNDILFAGNGGTIGSAGVTDADLIVGNDGNDRITGGPGLNVLYGGRGIDTLIGFEDAENRLHGQDDNDLLTGGNLDDYLSGGSGRDNINGLGGSDYVFPGAGDDTVDGGDGWDFVVFEDRNRQYRINGTATLRVRDMRNISGNQGTDVVKKFERLRFSDGIVPAVSPILEKVTIRPIVTANSNGSNVATFFGNATQEAEIKAIVDDIYYQANIDVIWENERRWNNTFANVGNGGNRPTSDLMTIVENGDNAGVGSSSNVVLDAYFVRVAAGNGPAAENVAEGLAFVGGIGSTIFIGQDLLGMAAGRRLVAKVVAHELAHNLGLVHVSAPANLMAQGTNLTTNQAATMIGSSFTRPV